VASRRKQSAGRIEARQVGMETYIEEFGAVASFAAALPLAGEVVDGRAGVLHGLHGRRGLADELLSLLCGGLLLLGGSGDGLSDGLGDVHLDVWMYVNGEVLGRSSSWRDGQVRGVRLLAFLNKHDSTWSAEQARESTRADIRRCSCIRSVFCSV
jgi:hypothetical protein